jgi:protoporphyrinogen oxidase
MQNDTRKHAVIAGAGPAGLTAAYQLLKEIPDIKVSVFEATQRIGGISTTISFKEHWIDIGGHRFFSKNRQVNDLWQALMPIQGKPAKDDIITQSAKEYSQDGPDPEKADNVMLVRNRVSRILYRRHFFDYPISVSPATFINMGLANTMKAGFSYIYSTIKKREEKSLEDFYINRFGRQLYAMFFEHYTEKVWGIHPSQLSPLWGAQRVKGLSITAVVKEALLKFFNPDYKTSQTSLINRFLYPKKGPGQLWSVMADKVKDMGGTIHLDSAVTGVHLAKNGIKEITVKSGDVVTKYACDYFLSSMPVKDLTAALDGDVPPDIRQTAQNLPYRDFITAGILVKKLNLVNKTKIKTVGNIIPDCWIYIQEQDVKIGRLQIFNNWSPYMVKDYQNTVWLGLEYFCNEGDMLWNMAEDAFIEFAAQELIKIKVIDMKDILDAVQIKIPKAYPAYFGSYDDMENLQRYFDSIDNLYCIGRNGQHKYNNMDHSMLTAIEAVDCIKQGKKDKSSVWNINQEGEYHESR